MSTTSAPGATAATPASPSPSPADGFISVPPGLAKVVVTETTLGDVRGDEGFYHYRQYSAVDLAERVSFEEAAHLLLVGHLPDGDELATFRRAMGSRRPLPPRLAALLPEICRTTSDSLQVLRTALSAWGGIADLRPLYDSSEEERREAVLTAVAVTPTILAAAHRLESERNRAHLRFHLGGRARVHIPSGAPVQQRRIQPRINRIQLCQLLFRQITQNFLLTFRHFISSLTTYDTI